jgi:gas vesicle protein
MDSGKLVLAALAGAATGALLGILFAPEKGSVTRRKIVEKGEDYAETLKEKFNEFVDQVAEKYEEVKENISGHSEKEKVQPEEA